ncbi:translational GTPase TypA [Candidatus Parcubacteria bacterium]|nr:translational GTPase TypA [Candidatus Parcubacteria bacterium]
MEIRNIAIIAHVDHGKTTLTDALMRQTGQGAENDSMDSNALEKERGITIYAKNTSVFYKDTKINIVDTPGHADFGSEVERVLRSIDTVLLVVDAQEGPMPQTRFVLKKSLELGLKPIVIINKIDKPAADPKKAHDEVFELFFELGASDAQLDFTTVYAIGREGIAKRKLEDESKDLSPLLDVILEKVPAAKTDISAPLQMQVFNLGYDNFLGRLAIGRIYEGTIKTGQTVFAKNPDGKVHSGKITKMFTFEGVHKKETTEAIGGDIVMIAGIPEIYIGDTVSESETQDPLPAIKVDEPTISLNFLVNDSPFAGREGKFVTGRQIRERLERELEINVGLKVDFSGDQNGSSTSLGSGYKVYGRGELHIAILLENMRREGYELQVSQPQVIIKEVDGLKTEPYEEVIIDVPKDSTSAVIDKLNRRRGIMMNMVEERGQTRLIFEIPTRGLLGYRGQFIIDTKGEGIISSRFLEFRPYAGTVEKQTYGSMISMENGKCLAFALDNLQQRGTLYIEPGHEVYEGQVVGNVTKGEDMYVNPTKGKQLTNMRASGSDDSVYLAAPFLLTIERAMEIMSDDEYIEITPTSVRLRKQHLTKMARDKAGRKA